VLGVIRIPDVQVGGLFKSNLRIDSFFLFKSSGKLEIFSQIFTIFKFIVTSLPLFIHQREISLSVA
jgi:hypothetical protein